MAGDIPLIRRLVRLGYDINTVNRYEETAVRSTVYSSHGLAARGIQPLPVLRALCEEGADVNWAPEDEIIQDAPILAQLMPVSSSDLDASMSIMKLLLKYGASLSQTLHVVSLSETNIPFIKVLLDAGADLEELHHGMTPLTTAASKGMINVVQALLDAGANVNGENDAIPLFAAIGPIGFRHTTYHHNTIEIFKMLCEAGADLTRLNSENDSILSFVLTHSGSRSAPEIDSGSSKIVEMLCKCGVDVNFRHYSHALPSWVEDGDTPLHIAPRATAVEGSNNVTTLIRYGADVNSQNFSRRTPLHSAARAGAVYCVRVLLQHGAKVEAKDVRGETALMVAEDTMFSGRCRIMSHYKETVALLREREVVLLNTQPIPKFQP